MRILIFNCSPVNNGATARIVDLVGNNLSAKNEIRSIGIDNYDIGFCKGCRSCHKTAKCVQNDGVYEIIKEFEWADKIICVSPSYWADIPGQFKVFIDRCTPWCDTHEPHVTIPQGKIGYVIALRTGPSIKECERIANSINHFYGHLGILASGNLGLCSVECASDVASKENEIKEFCNNIIQNN